MNKLDKYAFDIQLIQEVEKRQLLYNVDHKNYKNNYLRKCAWATLARILESDTRTCQSKWKYLKEIYFKEKSFGHIRSSHSESKKILLNRLKFLDNFSPSRSIILFDDTDEFRNDDETHISSMDDNDHLTCYNEIDSDNPIIDANLDESNKLPIAVTINTKHLPRLLPKPDPKACSPPKKRPKLIIQPLYFQSAPDTELQQTFNNETETIPHITYSDSIDPTPLNNIESISTNSLLDLMCKLQKERENLNQQRIDPFFQMLSDEMNKKSEEEQRLLKIKLFNIVFNNDNNQNIFNS